MLKSTMRRYISSMFYHVCEAEAEHGTNVLLLEEPTVLLVGVDGTFVSVSFDQ